MLCIRLMHMIIVAIILCSLLSTVNAQDIEPIRGIMPNSDQLSGILDDIGLIDGKLHLTIPLASLPRGHAGSGFDLNNSDSAYRIYWILRLAHTRGQWPDLHYG